MTETQYGGAPRVRRRKNYGDTSSPEDAPIQFNMGAAIEQAGDIIYSTIVSAVVASVIS